MAAARKSTSGEGEKEVRNVVDESQYPERPYGEAITPAHREFLKGEGFDVPKKATSEQGVVSE